MFTGIVERLGTFEGREGSQMTFSADLSEEDVSEGDSIAVNGCCLTVVAQTEESFSADVVEETLSRTNLGRLEPGEAVNLELAVRASDRMGGHLVQGHVDGTGTVRSPAPSLVVGLDPGLARYVVTKGSVTVDGVSLTVVQVDADSFGVAVIPHTSEATTLGRRRIGDRVNVEVDLVAKYVERLVAPLSGRL
ncbi:MAG: riboflavin synthase [Actinomycetota bacterium]|nr:riboflavin synthase [Actinomycetota bacterium]